MTNNELDSCKRDIEIIKSTIEKSKVNLRSIALLFIIYGISICCMMVAEFLIKYIPEYDVYFAIFTQLPRVHLLLHLVLLFVYLKNYAKLKKTNSAYTLRLYQVWGIAMFLMPLTSTVTSSLVILFFRETLDHGIGFILLTMPSFAEIIIFLFALMFTGIEIEKKSIVIICVLIIPVLFMSYYIHAEYVGTHAASMAARISVVTTIFKFLMMLYYVIVGICLLPKRNRDKVCEIE